MGLKNKPSLLYDASVIRNERADYHNTAERVGVMIVDLINAIDSSLVGVDDQVEEAVKKAVGNLDLSAPDVDISHLLTRAEFEEMFERVDKTGGDGWYIRTKADFVSRGESAAMGDGEGGEGGIGGGGVGGSGFLGEVVLGNLEPGDVLKWNGQHWYNGRVQTGLDEGALAIYLQEHNYLTSASLDDYATQDWVNEQGYASPEWIAAQGYLTRHQDISHLLTRAEFEEMFERVELANGGWYIRTKADFVSRGESAAMGAGDGYEGGIIGGGGLNEEQLAAYLTANNYITQADLGNYVTVDGGQTITGGKRFAATDTSFVQRITVNGDFDTGSMIGFPNIMWHVPNRRYTKVVMDTDGSLHIMDGGATVLNGAHYGIVASQFVKHGGTASQFLKADGSVDDIQYLYHRRTAEFFNIDSIDALGGGLYEIYRPAGTQVPNLNDWHKVFDWGANDNGYRVQMATALTRDGSMFFRHKIANNWYGWREILDSVNYQAYLDQRYVNKAGDKMTGLLQVMDLMLGYGNEINVSTGRLLLGYRDTPNGIVLCYNNAPLKYGSAEHTIWHAGNDGSGSGLDADLLDGYHEGSFFRSRGGINAQINNGYAGIPIINGSYFLSAEFPQWYGACHVFVANGSNAAIALLQRGNDCSQPELLLNLDGSSAKWYNRGHIVTTGYGNAPSATKLQTARTIYINSYNDYRVGDGVAFDGTGDVTLKLPNSITASDWFRSYGASGWYNQDYGGGIYMSDSAWVRVYNNKGFYSGTGEIRSDSRFNRMGQYGTMWNNGAGAYNVAVYNNANQTPLLHAYRDGAGADATGANRLFAMELLNSGALLRFGFGGAEKFEFHNSGYFVAYGDIRLFGNILADGESSAGSDRRLKSHIEPLTNRGLLEPKRFIKNGQWCLGFIAQEVAEIYPELVRDMGGKEHYLSLCYANITAVQATQIKELYVAKDDHEERIKRLEARL